MKTRFLAKFLGGAGHVNNALRKRLRVSLKFGSKELVDNMVKDTVKEQRVCRLTRNRGTQREYSSKPLKHAIVKRILVFKQ